MEVDHAVAEPALFQQLEIQSDGVRERPQAPSDSNGTKEQVALVDQPRIECVCGKGGAADRDVTRSLVLQVDIASGSNSRSIRVRALEGLSSVLE